MKICEKCGARQSARRTVCIDCGTRLGAPLTPEREQEERLAAAQEIDRLDRLSDPLRVTTADRIAGILGGAGCVAALVLSARWTERGAAGIFVVAAFFLALGALFLLVPRVPWFLERIRLSFIVEEGQEAEPSAVYRVLRRIGAYALLIGGIVFILLPMFGVT